MRINSKTQRLAPPDPLDLFKAFADPVRLRILNLLAQTETCVCHLHDALGLPQPTVSRHLAYLRRARLVIHRKSGFWVHYKLAPPASPLHRKLLECLPLALDPQTAAADRQKLAHPSPCDPSTLAPNSRPKPSI